MKKLTTLIALVVPLMTFAQLEKGRSILSGNLSYNVSGEKIEDQSTPTTRTRQYSFSATYAYLVGYRWAIGVGPTYQGTSQATPGNKNHFRSFSVSPFVRHYFPVGEKFFIHVDLGMSSTVSTNWNVVDGEKSPETKSTGLGFFLLPAASYFITPRVAVQASLGGLNYGMMNPRSNDMNTWNFGTSFGFSSLILGAAVYL